MRANTFHDRFPATMPAQRIDLWNLTLHTVLADCEDEDGNTRPDAQAALQFVNQSNPTKLMRLRRFMNRPDETYQEELGDITRDIGDMYARDLADLAAGNVELPELTGEAERWSNHNRVWSRLLEANLHDLLMLIDTPEAVADFCKFISYISDQDAAVVDTLIDQVIDRHRPALVAVLTNLAQDLNQDLRELTGQQNVA